MQHIDDLDMDMASEFIAMAATLIYIKSKSLLPSAPVEGAEEMEDPEAMLIQQLREYKAFKEAGECFNVLLQSTYGMQTRLPEEAVLPPENITLIGTSLEHLWAAFREAIQRENIAQPILAEVHEVEQDQFTIRSQIKLLRETLNSCRSILFSDLFTDHTPKLEIIVTFIALLEMIMRGEVHIQQGKQYGTIEIEVKNLQQSDEEDVYMDE